MHSREQSGASALLADPRSRPLRFVLTGGFAALVQIGVLHGLVEMGWESLLANAAAFLLATQVNFILGLIFTWRDRHVPGRLAHRWVGYHLSVGATAVLNLGVFVLTRTVLPLELAAFLGILAAGLANFQLGNRLVFRALP